MNVKITVKSFQARVAVEGDFSNIEPKHRWGAARAHVPLTLDGYDLRAVSEAYVADGIAYAVADYYPPNIGAEKEIKP